MQHTIRTQINSIALIIVPAAFGLVAVGIPLLSVLATTEFAQSTILIALIVGGISIDVFSTALQYIFYAQGRSDILRNIYLQAAVFNILANLIAIPLFSYNGAGLTTLLTFVYIFFALWRKTEMPFTALFDVSTIGRCLLAAIVMAGVVSLLVEATIPRLLVAMCVGGLTYGVGIILLRVVSVHDLLAIPRALRHRLKR
jgi:O-antigen/teichoic acid export membrane protein